MDTLGKEIRLRRLFDGESGRMLSVLIDHTIARGLMPGLIDVKHTLDRLTDGKPNAITMHKGIAEKLFPPHAGDGVSLILKVSTPSPYNPTLHAMVADVEEAVRLGADAVACGGIFCGKNQCIQMEHIAALVKECSRYGMPLIGHIYPNGETVEKEHREDWQNVAYAARAGAELGVDILKVHHSGEPETFGRIVESVPTHVVLAGGNAGPDIESYLKMAQHAVECGGSGIAFGRVIWQYEYPDLLIKALKLVVHREWTAEEAADWLRDTVASQDAAQKRILTEPFQNIIPGMPACRKAGGEENIHV